MKATGIVRKIDDLGRVVIPKEIRKNLHIREGDPLEIFIERNGEIVLKKFTAMTDMLDVVNHYAETLYKTTGFSVCIADHETILAVAGASKNEFLAKEISEHIAYVMDERAIWSTLKEAPKPIILGEKAKKYTEQIVAPIISEADAVGAVILFTTDSSKKITNVEYKLAESAATFLAKQMSS